MLTSLTKGLSYASFTADLEQSTRSFRGDAPASNPESRDSGSGAGAPSRNDAANHAALRGAELAGSETLEQRITFERKAHSLPITNAMAESCVVRTTLD